ncbi:hypothetical protein KUV73_03915 [Mameliella alba]|nr:hypothetical protein [Mameliella alba]MBY6168472.1 hypothetical protein [Mameliella alba]MBY6173492.1 hypothetical protein [Mameliella alba]
MIKDIPGLPGFHENGIWINAKYIRKVIHAAMKPAPTALIFETRKHTPLEITVFQYAMPWVSIRSGQIKRQERTVAKYEILDLSSAKSRKLNLDSKTGRSRKTTPSASGARGMGVKYREYEMTTITAIAAKKKTSINFLYSNVSLYGAGDAAVRSFLNFSKDSDII